MKPRHPNYKRMLKSALMCVCLVASSLSMLMSGATALPARAASPNGLVINEVFESQTASNEYFELYNTSGATINLSTYVIYNRDGNTPFSNLADPTIGPGEFRVITPGQLGSATIAGPTGLAQSSDFLGLVNTSPSDTIIDVVNWGGSANPAWNNYQRFREHFFSSNVPTMPPSDDPTRSLQRWPDGRDTDQGSDWQKIQRSPDSPSCADPYEGAAGASNDDTLAAAQPHEVGSGFVYLHRLCEEDDKDFFSFGVSNSLTYTVRVTPTTGSQVNAILRVYDNNNNQIAQDNDASNPGAIIVFKPANTGTYKAEVTNSGGSPSEGPAWLYNVNVSASGDTATTASPTPNTTDCNDVYEPDDQLGQARGIALNSEQIHLLCKPAATGGYTSDTDWIVVSASSGKVYSFITKNLAGPVDTIISLHLSNGDKLAENDDATPGQGLGSRIDYTFGGTGNYFLRIRDKSGASGPGYRYTVSFESTGQLPPTATSTASSTPNPFSPTPTPGQCHDAFEPDGLMETAKLMYISSTQRHSICPVGDADWIRFYARPGKVYTVRTLNLGVGVDTYMWVFDGEGKILGYDDDGGGEGVSSRIDFYPLADGFYFVQIKNAGDLGGSEQTYEIRLDVEAGVPQPPGTATGVAAPAVSPTPAADVVPTTVVQPTQQTAPTNPPLSSPTREGTQPTPALNEPTQALPPPQSTQQPTVARTTPTATTEPVTVPVPTVEAQPTAGDVVVPGVPNTGQVIVLPTRVIEQARPIKEAPREAQPQQLGTKYAPMLFRVFYDRNLNDRFDAGEGIRGMNIYFVGKDARNIALGSVVTEESGSGRTTLPTSEQRIVISYLGIDMPLTRFPERELHSIWLPKVSLPERVP
ncbi:MAG: lamin tail domain-containing protein [Chloroflexota bacterium]|nr:lamin tail domain-containing protein [Chloroflexota bacterium]MDQ5865305.1 lamin tail domain-containing protein [Chloroflexota bacterium]